MAQKSGTIALMVAAAGIVLIAGIAIGLFVASMVPAAEADPKNNPKALNGYVIVSAGSGSPSATATQFARAVCPEGKGPIAGGHQTSGSVDDAVVLQSAPAHFFSVQEPGSEPIFTPDSWLVSIKRLAGAGLWSMSAYAACVDIVAEAP